MDKTTNSHVNIDNKEIELLIISSIETLKRQNKKCGKDEAFGLVKDYLDQAITMESFEKSLELLKASHSVKCNIISNSTCLSIPKHSSIPKVSPKNASSTKADFEDFKSNFIETLNAKAEFFLNQQKELFFTEMNLFKDKLIVLLKYSTTSHSHEPSNKSDRIFSLLQDSRISVGKTKIQRQSYEFSHRIFSIFPEMTICFFCKRQQH